ncbi:EAL domain-containing protein [Sulfurimonas sp. MAG313]|nr:EAL domain-containing protein [Sulfurimonas sp. MAG313]MDF1881610.1 EAL domain-containing protein [Sulfurimonas sp. MAG313]
MNVRKPILLIFSFAIVSFFLFSELNSFLHGLQKAKDDAYAQNKINLNMILDLQMQSTKLIAMHLASDTTTIQAYLQNKPKLLIDDVLPFWEMAKKSELLYEIHFFKPPAVSFINFSNFNSLGKDVSKVRTDISWITSSFKNSSHLMVCKTYAGIRATFPIISPEGKMLGGVSLGKKVGWLPSKLKSVTKGDSFLVYNKSSVQSLDKKYYDNFLEKKSQIDDYILAQRTREVSNQTIRKINFDLKQQDIEIEGEEYSLNVFPLFDFENNIMAYIVVMNKLDTFYTQFYQRVLKNVLFLAILFFLIYLFSRQNIKRYLQRVASIEHLAHLFQEKDFSQIQVYDSKKLEILDNGDEIDRLKKDVVEMGFILRDSYENLHNEVDMKSHELEQINEQLKHQLYTNDMTGLPNRKAFFNDYKNSVLPQIAILNVNRFKIINDVYGVEAGNELLVTLSKLMLHDCDCFDVYHIGADEFGLLSKKEIPDADFEEGINNLIMLIDEHNFIVGEDAIELSITICAGISFSEENNVESADVALSVAKEMNISYKVYKDGLGLKKVHGNNIKLLRKIKDALVNGDMKVYYQPIVDANSKILKYEALIRLQDKDKVLSPYHFLDIAKKSKYYQGITKTVVTNSFELFDNSKISFSINLSADDISNEKTVDYILSALSNFSDPSRVVFEIVESESIDKIKSVQKFIDDVKTLGAKIAIDDFGTGYSNFSYLIDLRPDYLKIDGSLIRHIDKDENAYNIVKTIVQFAQTLEIITIAEFIHSKEVFDVAVSLGIDEFQGYYFGEPRSELQ